MSETITLKSGEVIDIADYPLPEGVGDDVVNMRDLAKGLDVTTVTIGNYIDAGMPVRKAGGNGVDYEFQLSHCFAWRQWRRAEEVKARAARDANLNQLALAFLGDDGDDGQLTGALTPKAIREYAEAELVRNKAAEQRGELMRRADMQLLIDDMLVAFRSAITSLPDWVEQEFSLSPSQVAKTQAFCDGVLADTRRRIEQAGMKAADVVDLDAGEAEAQT